MAKTQRTRRLTPFLAPLQALQAVLDAFGGQGVVIGGVAASLLGKARFTADIDGVLLLDLDDLPQLLQVAATHGLIARIDDAEAFARQSRVVLLRHQASGMDIDLALGLLPFEADMIARSQPVTVGDLTFRLPIPEDLIILKAVAQRPKDWSDIDAVIAAHPQLDIEHIRFWVTQFAEALDQPDLWSELERRLR